MIFFRNFKILIIICFFYFSSLSFAENDLSNFEIGGFSLNDSLLNKYSEKDIKKAKRKHGFKSKKYTKFAFYENFEPYQSIIIYTEKKDKSFLIKSIAGFIKFDNDWDGCLKEQNSTSEEIEKMFPNSKKIIDEFVHQQDKTGQSIEKDVIFVLKSGEEIGSACQSWGKKYKKKRKATDDIQVFMDTKEYAEWLRKNAY